MTAKDTEFFAHLAAVILRFCGYNSADSAVAMEEEFFANLAPVILRFCGYNSADSAVAMEVNDEAYFSN